MTRTELIAALEAAERPSRELDALIEVTKIGSAFNYGPLIYQDGEIEFGTKADNGRVRWCRRYKVPHYTSSIDAALSFTPEGMTLVLKIGQTWASAELYETIGMKDYQKGFAEHDEPAIAICIANFRAIEAQEEANG